MEDSGQRMEDRRRRAEGSRSSGFSLIEILVSVLLVGLAITALLAASNSFTMANGAGANLSTAEFLIEQIREMTAVAIYDDVADLDGATFSPPIGADHISLNDLAGFSQQVTVQNVNKSDFSHVEPDDSTDFIRITVTVSLSGHPISSASWIRARY